MADAPNPPAQPSRLSRRQWLKIAGAGIAGLGTLTGLSRLIPESEESQVINAFLQDGILRHPSVDMYQERLGYGNSRDGRPRKEGDALVVPIQTEFGPTMTETVKELGKSESLEDAKRRLDMKRVLSGVNENTFIRVEGDAPVTIDERTLSAAASNGTLVKTGGTLIRTRNHTIIYSRRHLANPDIPLVVKLDQDSGDLFFTGFAGSKIEFDVRDLPLLAADGNPTYLLQGAPAQCRSQEVALVTDEAQWNALEKDKAQHVITAIVSAACGFDASGTVELMQEQFTVRVEGSAIPALVIPKGTRRENAEALASAWATSHFSAQQAGTNHRDRLEKEQTSPPTSDITR